MSIFKLLINLPNLKRKTFLIYTFKGCNEKLLYNTYI